MTVHKLLQEMRSGYFYPTLGHVPDTRVLALYQQISTALDTVLQAHLPRDVVPILVAQIAPKSTVFCAALGCDYLDPSQDHQLVELGLAIALIYMIDHAIDRQHFGMQQAAADWVRQTTTSGLFQHLEATIQHFAYRDDSAILQTLARDIIERELRTAELSQHYATTPPAGRGAFWQRFGAEIAAHSVLNGGLTFVVGSLYSIARHSIPTLRPVAALYAHRVMQVLHGPASALIRLMDDLGDRTIDAGTLPEWGAFTLNVFNDGDPIWTTALAIQAGHPHPTIWSTECETHPMDAIEAIHQLTQTAFITARQSLPERDIQLLLHIAQQVTQAGILNARGDYEL